MKAILKDKCRIQDLVKPKIKYPEYFNQFRYKLPRQCLNVFEASTVKEEFEAFKKMLNSEIRKYDILKKEGEKKMKSSWTENFNKKTLDKAI